MPSRTVQVEVLHLSFDPSHLWNATFKTGSTCVTFAWPQWSIVQCHTQHDCPFKICSKVADFKAGMMLAFRTCLAIPPKVALGSDSSASCKSVSVILAALKEAGETPSSDILLKNSLFCGVAPAGAVTHCRIWSYTSQQSSKEHARSLELSICPFRGTQVSRERINKSLGQKWNTCVERSSPHKDRFRGLVVSSRRPIAESG